MSPLDPDLIADYLSAAAEHAAARKRFAEEFLLSMSKSGNSFVATQEAVDRTNDNLTLTAAKLKIAEERMVRE